MSEQVSAQISAKILDLRTRSGASRESVVEAAKRAGADRMTVPVLRNIEDGRRQATVDEVLWLATALEVPARDLVDEDTAKAFAPRAESGARGAVEEELAAAVEGLEDLDGREATLVEAALALARTLDRGLVQSPAAVVRELRMVMAEVWRVGTSDQDRARGEEGEFLPEQ